MAKTADPAERARERQIAQDALEREITHQRDKFNPSTQPRSNNGRYRKILARLKQELGDHELEQISQSINEAEKANEAGNYEKSTQAAQRVMTQINEIKSGAINESTRNQLRQGAADLGRVLAYLPLPQGVDTAKVRFSDLPPATRTFIKGLIDNIVQKLPADKARELTATIDSFLSGTVQMTADQIGAEMNRMLRFLVK